MTLRLKAFTQAFLPTLIICLGLISASETYAGMGSISDSIYGEMSNTSQPGKYETASRGVYSGGRYVMKSQIKDENLFNIQAPSWRGGCGGVDITAGSFSYINSDTLTTFLRQIASNSKGYAMNLALDAACPNCVKWMNEMQSKVQALNEHMRNSCQLAQGLVNSVANESPYFAKATTDVKLSNLASGFGDDWAEINEEWKNRPWADKKAKDPTGFADITGNVLWKAMQKSNAQAWFGVGGDQELIETIMTMTGSIVLTDLQPASGETDATQPKKEVLKPDPNLTLQVLVEGNPDGTDKIKVFNCSSDTTHCNITQATPKKEVTFIPIQKRLVDAVSGPTGLTNRIRAGNVLTTLPDETKNIIAALPGPSKSLLFRLAQNSPDAADEFMREFSRAFALELTYQIARQSLIVADYSMNAIPKAHEGFKQEVQDQINKSIESFREQNDELQAKYGDTNEIADRYAKLINVINKKNYVVHEGQ